MAKSRRGPEPEDKRVRDPRPSGEKGGQRNFYAEYLEEEVDNDESKTD